MTVEELIKYLEKYNKKLGVKFFINGDETYENYTPDSFEELVEFEDLVINLRLF